jgi:hypothetical protein
MSTDIGKHITNIAHSRRLESPIIIIIKGNKIAIEQKVAIVRPSLEKKNKIINPSDSPEKITSKSQPNLFLAIELVIGDCMFKITLTYFPFSFFQ